jgi:hypothetical protein
LFLVEGLGISLVYTGNKRRGSELLCVGKTEGGAANWKG